MNVLSVSATDLAGQRFNGQSLNRYLGKENGKIRFRQLVWQKAGCDPNTAEMLKFPGSYRVERTVSKIEKRFSIQALINPTALLLPREKYFQQADVVHYHLIYWPHFFSLFALPYLSRLKPSVWTIHDQWPITGHCIYSFSCEKWMTGCGGCPDLNMTFKMRDDRTHLNWEIKKRVLSKSNLHLVVASKLMFDIVSKSPIANHLPLSLVPFGLDLKRFKPQNGTEAKRLFGIDDDEIVIALRSKRGELKGVEYIRKALEELKTDRKICVLSFNEYGVWDDFARKGRVIELGWVHDEEVLVSAYAAADFFLMPSEQEAFGMMAMEAMACGKPVVVFDGTALPEVVGGPEIGIVVKMRDTMGLLQATKKLIEDTEFRKERGARSLEYAQKNYGIDLYVERLAKVYQTEIEKRQPTFAAERSS